VEGGLEPHVGRADVTVTGEPGDLADRLDYAEQARVLVPLVGGYDLGHGAEGAFLAAAERGADVDHRADQARVVRRGGEVERQLAVARGGADDRHLRGLGNPAVRSGGRSGGHWCPPADRV